MNVEEAEWVGGRAGVGVDREQGAGWEGRPKAVGKVGHHRAGRLTVGAGSVEPFIVDVDSVHSLGGDLGDRLGDGGCPVDEAGAHVRGAAAEVLQDDREHHLRAVGVGGAEQPRQLRGIPDRPARVAGDGPVVVDVQPEEGHRGQQVEVPGGVAQGGVGQAAGQSEAEDLALGAVGAAHGRLGRQRGVGLQGADRRPGDGITFLLHHEGMGAVGWGGRLAGRGHALEDQPGERQGQHKC